MALTDRELPNGGLHIDPTFHRSFLPWIKCLPHKHEDLSSTPSLMERAGHGGTHLYSESPEGRDSLFGESQAMGARSVVKQVEGLGKWFSR